MIQEGAPTSRCWGERVGARESRNKLKLWSLKKVGGGGSMDRAPKLGQHPSLKNPLLAYFVCLIQKHKEVVIVSNLLVAKLYANIEKHFPVPAFYRIKVNMFTGEKLETRKNDSPITQLLCILNQTLAGHQDSLQVNYSQMIGCVRWEGGEKERPQ